MVRKSLTLFDSELMWPAVADSFRKLSPAVQVRNCDIALAHGTGSALTKSGGSTWFFVTADYAFGYALERDTIAAVEASIGDRAFAAILAPCLFAWKERKAHLVNVPSADR